MKIHDAVELRIEELANDGTHRSARAAVKEYQWHPIGGTAFLPIDLMKIVDPQHAVCAHLNGRKQII
jgi:hypothetical protein